MFQLELNELEKEALADVLRSSLSDLTDEVVHTDRKAYRDQLKAHAQVVRQIMEKLERV